MKYGDYNGGVIIDRYSKAVRDLMIIGYERKKMNEINTQQHIESMRREFPDIPCACCKGEISKMCQRYKTCIRYRAWFDDIWHDLREKFGVTDEGIKYGFGKGR